MVDRTRVRSHWRAVPVAPVIAAMTLSAGAPAPAQQAPEAVVTYPGPGWEFASPDTTITVQGARVDQLAGMRVTGSESGAHAGTLRPLRLGPGAVFVPERAFGRDEHV